MEKQISDSIGTITIKKIKDYILNSNLGELDTVLLNSNNFDDIVLEYRETYNQNIVLPFYLIRVLISEDTSKKIPLNNFKAIRNDNSRYFEDYLQPKNKQIKFSDLDYSDKTIFRCSWCGNIVKEDGSFFDSETRKYKIEILEKFESEITEKKVDGKCCPNGGQELPNN